MQDGGIRALGVVLAFDLPRSQGQFDAAQERRMRVGVEVGVDQVP
jgi:hypothetical protein